MTDLVAVRRIVEWIGSLLEGLQWISRVREMSETHDAVVLTSVLEDAQVRLRANGGLRLETQPVRRHRDLRHLAVAVPAQPRMRLEGIIGPALALGELAVHPHDDPVVDIVNEHFW